MQKGDLIAQGNTAEVYCWGDCEILKLFKKEFPIQAIEKEYRVSREVQECGLPIPKVGIMVEDDGRLGITYERIYGDSMLKIISQRPWMILRETGTLADLHNTIHKCTIKGIPGQKEVLKWNIQKTELLTDEKKRKIFDVLDGLPDGEALCHGDFHPGNIILGHQRAVILDWMTATSGNPAADIARTILLLKGAALPSYINLPARVVFSLVRKAIYLAYFTRYLKLSGLNKLEIRQWEVPVAAARLTEWIPEQEKEYLLELIDKGIT